MSQANVFGPIVTAKQVEGAVVAMLDEWMPDYLSELERQDEDYAPGEMARPRDIVIASEFERRDEVQLPCIVVISDGLTGKPERKGDGTYDAEWRIGVAAIVSDVDEAETRSLAQTYATAIRLAMVQHKRLKSTLHPTGFADWMTWEGEGYADVSFNAARSFFAGQVLFTVGVENVAKEAVGPRQPSGEEVSGDPGPLPTLHEVDIDAEPVPLAEAFA